MNFYSEKTTSMGPRAIASLLFLCLMTVGLAALPAQAAPPKATTVDYVAVGDSYTAGQGAPPYEAACYRSPSNSYPAKVDALKGVALKLNAACSGATTDDIPAQLPGDPGDLNYQDRSASLVTVTVGGIDAGSNQVATACEGGVVDDDCKALLTITAEEETVLEGKLARAYSAIAEKYPAATVAVMGYPKMFGGFYLWYDFPRALNDSIAELDRIIMEQAAASKVKFVDVRQEFVGHEIGSFQPWINYNADNASDPANFHPNATGYKSGYYQALVNDGLIPRR